MIATRSSRSFIYGYWRSERCTMVMQQLSRPDASSLRAWQLQYFSTLALVLHFRRASKKAWKSTAISDPDSAIQAKALWCLMVQSQSNERIHVMLCLIGLVEKCNSFIAWKQICQEFQPLVGGRHNTMLTALLHPPVRDGDFEALKEAWGKKHRLSMR